MIKTNYKTEHYVNPFLTYGTLSDKIKLNQILFNQEKNQVQIVDLAVFSEIIEFEKDSSTSQSQKYYPIPLSEKWLCEVFNFDKKFLAPQAMNIYISKTQGLKIHEVRNQFRLGFTIREKSKGNGFSGSFNFKPRILFVHELMDQIYLLKREQYNFLSSDIDLINKIFDYNNTI